MSKYKEGDIVTSCVTGIEKYGIFVGLDEYYSGLIHISEISEDFVRNINDYVAVGETIKARILEVEHKILPVAISLYCNNRLEINNGKVRIKNEKSVD